MGRNTAPAIALAAFDIARKDPEAIMAVLPADHVIKDGKQFRDAMSAASADIKLEALDVISSFSDEDALPLVDQALADADTKVKLAAALQALKRASRK